MIQKQFIICNEHIKYKTVTVTLFVLNFTQSARRFAKQNHPSNSLVLAVSYESEQQSNE